MSVGERIPNTFKYYISFASGCGDIAIGSRTQAVGGWGGGVRWLVTSRRGHQEDLQAEPRGQRSLPAQ